MIRISFREITPMISLPLLSKAVLLHHRDALLHARRRLDPGHGGRGSHDATDRLRSHLRVEVLIRVVEDVAEHAREVVRGDNARDL